MKILFIEDEIFTNQTLAEFLETKYGNDFIWLQNANKAVAYVENHVDYDLVILDIMMAPPDGKDEISGIDIRTGYSTGLGILKLINDKNPNAKVIIFSARNDFDNEKILEKLKYNERLLKPRQVEDIIYEIEQLRKKN